MKLTLFLLLIFMISCKQQDNDNTNPDNSKPNTEIIETFTDSLNIGEKGNCKIELIKHRVFEGIYVIVNFYTKQLNDRKVEYWGFEGEYLYNCYSKSDLEPEISDFNNDKLNDITFNSGWEMRGGNITKRLFIYDGKEKKLISIENSEEYPNISYNNELDCIDSFILSGGNSTVFLRLKGDRLEEFASIENDVYRDVYEIDKFGKRQLIRRDTITNEEDYYTRYTNYKPLKEKVYKD